MLQTIYDHCVAVLPLTVRKIDPPVVQRAHCPTKTTVIEVRTMFGAKPSGVDMKPSDVGEKQRPPPKGLLGIFGNLNK